MKGRGARAALTLASALALALGVAAPRPVRGAGGRLDEATLKVFSGTYAVDCRRAGVRLTVAADTLAVESGAKRVESHDVQRARTFGGAAMPADYQGTLLGDIAGGDLIVFQAYRDARGVYLVVDADTKLQATFGKAALAPKFRSCDMAAKPEAPAGKPKRRAPAAQ
jgi:hypothetical protein